jgi:uncharacterized protein (TIGR00251 family)
LAKWYDWEGTTLLLRIQLQPRASRDKIIGPHGDYLKICITAPPLEGRANKHLIKFLANCFDVPQHQVTIEKGEQSRIKRVRIDSPKNTSCIDENRFC